MIGVIIGLTVGIFGLVGSRLALLGVLLVHLSGTLGFHTLGFRTLSCRTLGFRALGVTGGSTLHRFGSRLFLDLLEEFKLLLLKNLEHRRHCDGDLLGGLRTNTRHPENVLGVDAVEVLHVTVAGLGQARR